MNNLQGSNKLAGKSDIIIITGKPENCERARQALLVGFVTAVNLQLMLLIDRHILVSFYFSKDSSYICMKTVLVQCLAQVMCFVI